MDYARSYLSLFVLICFTTVVSSYEYDPDYLVPPKCKPCDARLCPQLTYCAGEEVKDHCGCCPRCSSGLFQPHVPKPVNPEKESEENEIKEGSTVTEGACKERQCPKFQVCMINMQGIPICACPSAFVCKRRRSRREKKGMEEETLCGTDGNTYETRCHMRIANCNSAKRIKRKHIGACTEDDVVKHVGPTLNAEQIEREIKMEEERELAREKNRLKTDRITRRKIKRQKTKERRKRKEKRDRKERERAKRKNRRSKRRNEGYSVYSRQYGYLLGKHTKWGRSQIRKSRI